MVRNDVPHTDGLSSRRDSLALRGNECDDAVRECAASVAETADDAAALARLADGVASGLIPSFRGTFGACIRADLRFAASASPPSLTGGAPPASDWSLANLRRAGGEGIFPRGNEEDDEEDDDDDEGEAAAFLEMKGATWLDHAEFLPRHAPAEQPLVERKADPSAPARAALEGSSPTGRDAAAAVTTAAVTAEHLHEAIKLGALRSEVPSNFLELRRRFWLWILQRPLRGVCGISGRFEPNARGRAAQKT